MSDPIERQDALKALRPIMRKSDYFYEILKAIQDVPHAEPERKKGKWINAYPDIEPNPMFMYGICSVCGYEQAISNKLNFCPNCGAKMEGEQNG